MKRPRHRSNPFRFSIQETRSLLLMLDLTCLLGTMVFADYVIRGLVESSETLFSLLGHLATICVFWMFLAIVADIYDIGNSASWVRSQRATVAAIATCFLFHNSFPGSLLVFGQVITFAALPVILIGAIRCLYTLAYKAMPLKQKALIFGAGRTGQDLAKAVCEFSSDVGVEIVGFVDDDPKKLGHVYYGLPVLGTSLDIGKIVDQERIDTLVVAVNSAPIVRANSFPSLLAAREGGTRIVSMPTMYEHVTRRVAIEYAGANFGVFFPLEDYQQPFINDAARRMLDVFAGLVGCLLLALIIPIVAIANRFGNPGPLIFCQKRIGLGGRVYHIYKLRSMVVDAEKDGAQWASQNDPRITAFGGFLRRTRIDEMPQFWNILKGDMSLVGPRPERPEFVSKLELSIPFYRARHAVKPGLTGWAQVMYRYGSSAEDAMMKLQYDLYYIKHRSIPLDLRIVGKTIKVVLFAKGR